MHVIEINIKDLEVIAKRCGTKQDGWCTEIARRTRPTRCRLAMTLIEQYGAEKPAQLWVPGAAVNLLQCLNRREYDYALAFAAGDLRRYVIERAWQKLWSFFRSPFGVGADLAPKLFAKIVHQLVY